MNISNLEQVNNLVEIKARCINALEQLAAFANDADEVSGSDDPYGYDVGYNAAICSYSDGSGSGADMTGCYVGRQLACATREILEEQIQRVDDDLMKLGITLGI